MRIHDARPWVVRALDQLDVAPDGLAARALMPLGVAYGALGALQRSWRPFRSLPGTPPSIGVGNLRVGGTGKTPVVADLGRRLVERGLRVVVLSRGYRADGGGDEPQWLRELGLDVVLDADRGRGHREATRRGADVVLLDDALHCRDRAGLLLPLVLERDLLRTPRILPAGPARGRPDVLLAASTWLVRREGPVGNRLPAAPAGVRLVGVRLEPACLIDPEGREVPLHAAAGLGPVLAVSGLARPDSFESDLRGMGIEVAGAWRGPDHWAPGVGDAASILALARSTGVATLLCPEKNRERLRRQSLPFPVWTLRSRLAWEHEDVLGATGIAAHLDLR